MGDEWRTGEAIDALNALVQGLVQHAKEKDVSLRKAMARTKALEASLMGARTQAYAAPLEASQRAVIRDLTARCNQLAHEKAAMRADRDRLQERLSQLRASLGQGTGAARAAAAEGESQEGKGPRAPSLDVEAVLRRLEGDGDAAAEVARTKGARAPTAMGAAEQGHGARVYPEARELQGVVEVRGEEASEVLRQAQGMGELLAQHMGEMEAARGKVAAVAEALAGPGPIRGGEVGRLFVSEEQRRALVEGAGEMAAELQAMRSAVRVLLEDVGALGAMVGRAGERDEGEGEDPRVAAAVAAQREAEAEAEEAREDAEAARREAEGAREELEAARGESRRLQVTRWVRRPLPQPGSEESEGANARRGDGRRSAARGCTRRSGSSRPRWRGASRTPWGNCMRQSGPRPRRRRGCGWRSASWRRRWRGPRRRRRSC